MPLFCCGWNPYKNHHQIALNYPSNRPKITILSPKITSLSIGTQDFELLFSSPAPDQRHLRPLEGTQLRSERFFGHMELRNGSIFEATCKWLLKIFEKSTVQHGTKTTISWWFHMISWFDGDSWRDLTMENPWELASGVIKCGWLGKKNQTKWDLLGKSMKIICTWWTLAMLNNQRLFGTYWQQHPN